MEDEFGYGGFESEEEVATPTNEANESKTNLETGKEEVNVKGGSVTNIDEVEKPETKEETVVEESNIPHDFEVGTVVEYEDSKYTVDAEGNLVDAQGNVFKDAKDVKSWVDSLNADVEEQDEDAFDINKLQEEIGVTIVDNENNPIEFDNSPAGVKSYVQSVIENSKQQIIDSTIDALYNKYPILENVINYYVANGNSLEGFNEIRDRSKITIDVNNEAQCEAIIREAWREDNRRGNVDSYIEYLKSQNMLAATAEDELKSLVEKDNYVKEQLSKQAEEKEKQDIENQKAYWGAVYNTTVTNKQIGKYRLPDTIIINKNGTRTSATPNDFFNYLYLVDENGHSQYENEIMSKTPESRLNDNLLAAYLMFTGGTYESLVNMAINEEKVKTIKLKSKTSPKAKIKVTPKTNKTKSKDIDFGY